MRWPALCEYQSLKSFHNAWAPRWVAVWTSRANLRASSSLSSSRTCRITFFWRWGIDGQATKPFYVCLRLPGAVFHCKVILLQCGRPAVEKSGSRSHRPQPLQRLVVGVDLKWHRHQVRSELCDGPDDGEALQLGGWVRFLCLVEGARGAADDALLAFPDLSEDCAETCGRCVGI